MKLYSRNSYKNYIKKFFKTGKGKLGIIVYHSYSAVEHVIEVEEIESAPTQLDPHYHKIPLS
jgi:hypothetical protein